MTMKVYSRLVYSAAPRIARKSCYGFAAASRRMGRRSMQVCRYGSGLDGFHLYFIPRSEVSAVGQGAIFIAPTANGPVADLMTSDFVGDANTPMIVVERWHKSTR